jgi:hypothetical protein
VLLAPYYRRFELPWEGDSEASQRYRRILQVGLALLLLLGILIPLLPAPPRPASEEAIPQRLARVMIENQVKPPPPPPPPVQEAPKVEPVKKIPVTPPPVDRTQQAREKAEEPDGRRGGGLARGALAHHLQSWCWQRRHYLGEFEPGLWHRRRLAQRT